MSSKPDPIPGKEELRRKPGDHLKVTSAAVDQANILSDGSARSRKPTVLPNVGADKGKGKDEEYSSDFGSPPPSRKQSGASNNSEGRESQASDASRESVASALDGNAEPYRAFSTAISQLSAHVQAMTANQDKMQAVLLATAQEVQAMKARGQSVEEAKEVNSIVTQGLGASPKLAKEEQRKSDLARQVENSNLPEDVRATLLRTLGLTAAKVNPSPLSRASLSVPSSSIYALPDTTPDVVEAVRALTAAQFNTEAPWASELGRQVVQQQAVRQSQEARVKKLKLALESYDKFYAYLWAEGMLGERYYGTYSAFLHQVKQLELNSGWSVAKQYVEWAIDVENKYKDPRTLQQKVGPTPADGHFFRTLDVMGVLKCQLASLARVEAKLGGKARDPSKKKSSSSTVKDDKHKYFCKHHNMYYSSPDHTTDTCRKGKRLPNASPASRNGGAGSD